MNNPKLFFVVLTLLTLGYTGYAQEKVGENWVDNNLTFAVTNDQIKGKGVFTFCVMDTTQGYCVENLSTGVEVRVFNRDGKEIWKGIGSGRAKTLKLAKPLPEADYLMIKAFKPHVVNRSTGTLIHQDKPIEIKYYIK
ncbi:MAG TPA: hypothetical protein DCG19_02695 [Cryomorphaceae bacterium]|nr:hypothetical protein [Owenweeksia sp.]MBF98317.1 hypothetical protein [Owenweeksia sp.]HAD96283.1 hypothetical protein [Cryomorphaceae bacterium]HBF21519.1 hypothetical protein [Cryomorphaceae bacterium]HCQ17419.1 hypothetical protein [Cryomorphaceae bacterium]|tara:strand:- start:1492 stop:1905 length:414 start_codon:yes stop_codon:yes gene_type:complete